MGIKKKAVKSPEWILDSVIYEMFPRVHTKEGDFKSIIPDLDRIKETGANVIWLTPIHPVGQKNKKGTLGCPYAVKDYRKINEEYGDENDFKKLIKEIHDRGLKIIIDWVANHCAWDNKVIFENKDWLVRDKKGEVIFGNPDWTDTAKLNYDSEGLREYIIGSMIYWIKEFGIDGFRCDVASMVPTDFWEDAREELKKIKSDILLLAESNETDLHEASFDITYESEMRKKLRDIIQKGESADIIREMYEEQLKRFPKESIRLRFIENHDEERAIVYLGQKERIPCSIIIYMLDGVPLIWAGQESGDKVYTDWHGLFDKLEMDWKAVNDKENMFYSRILKIRNDNNALRRGETRFLINSCKEDAVTYLRSYEDDNILICANIRNEMLNVNIGLGSGRGIDLLSGEKINFSKDIKLKPLSGRIIKIFGAI